MSDAKAEIAKIRGVFEKVKSEARFIDQIDFSQSFNLPIGITKNIGGTDYTICIDSVVLDINKFNGYLCASLMIQVPGQETELFFRGTNIRFNKGGLNGEAKLLLLEDASINQAGNDFITFKASEGQTFVEFDCYGFKQMGLSADIKLPISQFSTEDNEGNATGLPVTGSFRTTCSSWGDLLVEATLPAFQIKALPRFGFKASKVVIDQSQKVNSGMIFPVGYSYPTANSPTWEGIYIAELSVRLPKSFKSTDNQSTSFSAYNVLIDEQGLSGLFKARQLLSIEKGKIGTWAFSVDSLGIGIAGGQITQAAFSGGIIVPMIDKQNPLKYGALIEDGGNYMFTIANSGQLNMSALAAKIRLDPNSSITISQKDDVFYPKANLNGSMTIESGSNKLVDIKFQNLKIQTIAPIVSATEFSIASDLQSKVSGFPVSIDNISLKSDKNDVGVGFNLNVNFVGAKDGGFSGKAGFIVWSKYNQSENGITAYSFKKLELTSVKIDINGAGFKLIGEIENIKNDPIYGDGFRGYVDAEFTPGVKVKAIAQFGNVNGYSYWMADAMLGVPTGIPIFPGISIFGFGGGASYHMARRDNLQLAIPTSNVSGVDQNIQSESGKSRSGVAYVPDVSKGLGIRAKIYIGTTAPQAFNGDAGFELMFNTGGGISKITIEGNGYFLTELYKGDKNSPIAVKLLISYDFDNETLFGNMEAYVNVAGVIQGAGANNLAGRVTILFSPDEWYIYIGHPDRDKRIGIKLIKLFRIDGYMVMGTDIPGIPDPPAEVSEILGKDYSNSRDVENTLKGGGFAFGASASVSTGDITFLIFYANLSAGIGFDVMLKDLGTDARCEGSSSPIGMNGWYAAGQVYAYVRGEVGIEVDLFAVSGRFPILSIGAAAILQAKLPNPTWMRGAVGGYFNILGGLVSGRCKFEFEIGEKCKIVGGSPLAGVKVISECSPAKDATAIDVFNTPQATFNLEIGKIFEFRDMDNNLKAYRAVLDYFKIKDGTTDLRGDITWNDAKDVALFNPFDILPSNKNLTLQVQVHFEEMINGNWQNLMYKGQVATEKFESKFITGTAPDFIPHQSVVYSYPLMNQYNFHSQESTQGYIQLKQGRPDLFTQNSDWIQKVRYTPKAGNPLEVNVSYQRENRRIVFSQPTNMNNQVVYSWQIMNIPTSKTQAVDKNVTTGSNQALSSTASDGSTASLKKRDVEGTMEVLQEKSIFDSYFRTSKYNTFVSKMNSATYNQGWMWQIYPPVDRLYKNIYSDEPFDKHEVSGLNQIKPLILYEASTENEWYKKDIYPLVYEKYPLGGTIVVNWRRNVDSLGVPPIRAISMSQIPNDVIQEDGMEPSMIAASHSTAFEYDLPHYFYQDFDNLRNQAANSMRLSNPDIAKIIGSNYVVERPGNYTVTAKYILPGQTEANSQYNFVINKP